MSKKTIILIALIIFGCSNTDAVESGLELSQEDISASLEKSAETLDNMIVTTEKMTRDLEIMIQNQDAIFKAITQCISEETCESLKASLASEG
tara:strand:+ start:1302 stop:1580 length:279 start_codon:yes stop_codon:yes gene_type:complete